MEQIIIVLGSNASYGTCELCGAVNEELFLDTQAEMFFVMAKLTPLLPELREKMQSPDMMRRCETLINKSDASKEKLKVFIARVERFRAMAAAAAAKK